MTGLPQGTYQCPTCHGGFPADALDDDACPWCGQELGEAEQNKVIEHVAKREAKEEKVNSVFRRLLE